MQRHADNAVTERHAKRGLRHQDGSDLSQYTQWRPATRELVNPRPTVRCEDRRRNCNREEKLRQKGVVASLAHRIPDKPATLVNIPFAVAYPNRGTSGVKIPCQVELRVDDQFSGPIDVAPTAGHFHRR
jgi:hypothetical protein